MTCFVYLQNIILYAYTNVYDNTFIDNKGQCIPANYEEKKRINLQCNWL